MSRHPARRERPLDPPVRVAVIFFYSSLGGQWAIFFPLNVVDPFEFSFFFGIAGFGWYPRFLAFVSSGERFYFFPLFPDNAHGSKVLLRTLWKSFVAAAGDPSSLTGTASRLIAHQRPHIDPPEPRRRSFAVPSPSFPADYPDTVAGRRHWDEIGRLSEETWTRTRPKHRGFKRHPPLPTAKASGSGKAAAAAAGHGNGGGNEGTESGQAQQSEPPTKAEPTVSSSPWLASQFRPDFRSLAGAAAIAAAAGAAAGAGGGPLTASTGGAGGDDPVLREARGQRREPYAVARGFHYVRAFLPEEKEEPDEDPGVVRTVGRMGSLLHPPPPPPPLPPLLLAFSTVVGLVVRAESDRSSW